MDTLNIKKTIIDFLEENGITKMLKDSSHDYKGILSVHHMEGSVYDHIMLVLKEAEYLDAEDGLLILSALLHDIGKIFTRVEVEEKGKTQFLGHELYSVNWVRDNLTHLLSTFLPAQQVFFLYQLIQYHMYNNVKKVFKKNMGKILVEGYAPLTTYLNLLRADNRGRITEKGKSELDIFDMEDSCKDQKFECKFGELYSKDVPEYIKEIMTYFIHHKQLMIIPISAQAGGKSTIKKNLIEKLKETKKHKLIDISFDQYRVDLYSKTITLQIESMTKQEIYEQAFQYCKAKGINLLQMALDEIRQHQKSNEIIYIDNMNLSFKRRQAFTQMNRKRFHVIALYLDNPLSFHLTNNIKRKETDKTISADIIRQCYYQTQLPVPTLEFDEIIYCRG